MQKSNFITLLQTLSPKEIKAFDRFLRASYPNQQKVLRLYSILRKQYPRFDKEKIQQDPAVLDLLSSSNGDAGFRKKLGNAFSTLNGFLLEFLLLRRFKNNKSEFAIELLEIYKERKLDDLYFQKLEQMRSHKGAGFIADADTNYRLYEINRRLFYHTNSEKINTDDHFLSSAMSHLDECFVVSKLKLACEMQNRENLLQQSYHPEFVAETLAYCSQQPYPESHPARFYALILQLLQQGEEPVFDRLKKNLLECGQSLNKEDQLIVLSYLLNFTSAQIKRGRTAYYREAFDLFDFGLRSRLLIADGFISATQFHNIVSIACKLKHYDWANEFIRGWKPYLKDSYRESVVGIADAYVFFATGNFDEAITRLVLIHFNNDYFSVRSRSILLQCYYEKYGRSGRELILDHCKAFANFLDRNKTLHSGTIQGYRTLVEFVRQFVRKKVDPQKLMTQLEKTPFVFFKPWIESKIEEMGKNAITRL